MGHAERRTAEGYHKSAFQAGVRVGRDGLDDDCEMVKFLYLGIIYIVIISHLVHRCVLHLITIILIRLEEHCLCIW